MQPKSKRAFQAASIACISDIFFNQCPHYTVTFAVLLVANELSVVATKTILGTPLYYFVVRTGTAEQGMVWNGRRFFHIPYWQFSSIPFPFHTKNLPFHIPFHTKIFFDIPFHISIPKKF